MAATGQAPTSHNPWKEEGELPCRCTFLVQAVVGSQAHDLAAREAGEVTVLRFQPLHGRQSLLTRKKRQRERC